MAAATAKKTTKTDAGKPTRFLGWQNTPIQQASFGGTTKGGSRNVQFSVKHSTGEIQSVTPKWYLIDASEAPIGRVATTVATLLMGKHRTTYTKGAGAGDSVAVINADKSFFTSDKADKKIYYWHTGYMGGLKSQTAKQALQTDCEEVLKLAVQGMMPKNKLSRYQLTHLKVYRGTEHPHKAQNPTAISLKGKALKGLGV